MINYKFILPRLPSLDPELQELRAAIVAIAAMLLTFGSTLLMYHAAHIRPDGLAQAVIFPLMLARTQRRASSERRRLLFLGLPIVALVLAQIDWFFLHRPYVGGALFVIVAGLAIWTRRFGTWGAALGTLVTLTLISTLLIRVKTSTSRLDLTVGAAGVALVSAFWVISLQALADHSGFCSRIPRVSHSAGSALSSQRMAAQVVVALSLAFVAGHYWFPLHWNWVLLSAMVVCTGARSRGDVVHKGALRAIGAATGTVGAGLIVGSSGLPPVGSIVLLFILLTGATWLRSVSYAFWAGGITASLALVYGLCGHDVLPLLHMRFAGIIVGAILGIGASWLVLPIRTTRLLQRRVLDALVALSGLFDSDWREVPRLESRLKQFQQSVEILLTIAPPLEAHRFLVQRNGTRPHPVDAIDAIRQCLSPVQTLVKLVHQDCDRQDRIEFEWIKKAILADIFALQHGINDPVARYQHIPPSPSQGSPAPGSACSRSAYLQAWTTIDAALFQLARIIPQPSSHSAAPLLTKN